MRPREVSRPIPAKLRLLAIAAVLAALGTWAIAPPAEAQRAGPPGKFDYYVFSLSWSPAFCTAHRDDRFAREECGRHRSFVVHGLWPQFEDGSWPATCRVVPRLSPAQIERELPIMPNRRLVEHEWEKHGSCTNYGADGYFDQLRRAFAKIRIPDPLKAPQTDTTIDAAQLKSLFSAANPGLTPDMMALACEPKNVVLRELRICLDRNLGFRACGAKVVDTCPDRVDLPPVGSAGK